MSKNPDVKADLAAMGSHVGHIMDMPYSPGGPASTAQKWCETDDRFAGVDAGDVTRVLQEAMRGTASLVIVDYRNGDIEFGHVNLSNPGGRPNRSMTIEDVIARAKAMRAPKKEKTR